MPNGFRGPKEQWERMETPLQALDPELEAFSERHGISLARNSRAWPDRSLVWGDTVRRLIQIYVEDEKAVTYTFWICASEDRGNKRFWKQRLLKESVPIAEIATALSQLLEEGRTLLESWGSDALEFATEIDSPR